MAPPFQANLVVAADHPREVVCAPARSPQHPVGRSTERIGIPIPLVQTRGCLTYGAGSYFLGDPDVSVEIPEIGTEAECCERVRTEQAAHEGNPVVMCGHCTLTRAAYSYERRARAARPLD